MYSLHGLFLCSLYATTEIDKTNVFLYSSQSSISTQHCYLYHIPMANGLSQDQYIIHPLHIVHSCIIHLNGAVCQYASFMFCCTEAMKITSQLITVADSYNDYIAYSLKPCRAISMHCPFYVFYMLKCSPLLRVLLHNVPLQLFIPVTSMINIKENF